MKRSYARTILFVAAPVLIVALGMLIIQLFLRSAVTKYVENALEEKIGSHLNQASGDSLDIKIQKLKFNTFPVTVLTPEISIYVAAYAYNKDSSAKPCKSVYEAGVINLEISLKPLVLIALGREKFNINLLQADSVYLGTKRLSEKSGVGYNSRLKIQSGPIFFKGKIEMSDHKSNFIENLTFDKHSFQVANLSVDLPQKLYSFHIDSISLDGPKNIISMEKIKMLPIYSKEEFYRHVDFETDRIETHLDKIEIKGLRTYKKQGRSGLMVSQVNIRNGLIDVFRDRRPPFNKEQRPAMPARLILSAPVDLFVAEINISKTNILYSEFPDDGSESGVHEAAANLPFNRLEATVRNITNIADSLHKDSIMHISATAFVFDDAMLRADFTYNLNDINGGYSADVALSEFRFETINPVLYPLAGIKVTKGNHKGSVFSFTGNDVKSSGALYMEWNDLSLNFTPEAGGMITGITKSLGKMAYHQSNPDTVNNSPTGEIYYERDIRRFVFHYWWHCYLSGIKSSVIRDFVPL
jgi:hypothetical protein